MHAAAVTLVAVSAAGALSRGLRLRVASGAGLLFCLTDQRVDRFDCLSRRLDGYVWLELVDCFGTVLGRRCAAHLPRDPVRCSELLELDDTPVAELGGDPVELPSEPPHRSLKALF
jgi:hypothetical protein